MGGCNCKGKGTKQITNRLDSPDHIQYGKDVYNRVVLNNTTQEFSDMDKIEIIGAYSTLYPASSQTPTIEDAINKIKEGIELFDVKYTRRK
jgi:hypothetical protein